MTNLDILDGHIAQQEQICADAKLRLRALRLARHTVVDRTSADRRVICLDVTPDKVSVFILFEDAVGADVAMAAKPEVVSTAALAAADPKPMPPPAPPMPEAAEAAGSEVQRVSSEAKRVPARAAPAAAGTALVVAAATSPVPSPVQPLDDGSATKIDNRAALAKEWPADAVAELRRRYAAGEATADIATAMGRTTKQVTNKAFRLGLRRAAAPCDQALPMKSVAKRPARHATPKATGKSKPQQTVAQRLDALGNSKLWTPERDLILALSWVRGDSASTIGNALKLAPDDVNARWVALCPNRNDKPAINALVRELKVRAHV